MKCINFRNLRGSFHFSEGFNLVLGPNGVGKTSLLEAIAYLSVPRSFRGVRDYALVKWGERHFFLEARITRMETPINLTAYVEIDERGNTAKKIFKKDGRSLRTYQDVFNTFVVLSFSSREHAFVDGPPAERRKFFDWALSLLDGEYFSLLSEYKKLLKEKKILLQGKGDPLPINRMMSRYVDGLVKKRSEFVSLINTKIKYDFLPGGFKLSYRPNVPDGKTLLNLSRKEMEMGRVSFGPHRDRFDLLLGGKPVKLFASEGQKRRIHLAIVLFVRDLLERKLQDSPVMVLDEPFVYLDREGIEGVIKSLRGQTFVSATRRPDIPVEWEEIPLR